MNLAIARRTENQGIGYGSAVVRDFQQERLQELVGQYMAAGEPFGSAVVIARREIGLRPVTLVERRPTLDDLRGVR